MNKIKISRVATTPPRFNTSVSYHGFKIYPQTCRCLQSVDNSTYVDSSLLMERRLGECFNLQKGGSR